MPPTCAGCGTRGSRWCTNCQGGVRHPPLPVCPICGVPLGGTAHLCPQCARLRPAYRALRSWSIFEAPVRNALHRLKYRRDVGLGEALTPQLLVFVESLGWEYERVVPVPLSGRRLSERGYNQASLIARPLALAMGIPYVPGALARTRDTRSQVGLTRTARRENVNGAFQGHPKSVRGLKILVVDDVATTGATLSACAESLYAAGAREVFGLTVARAYPHQRPKDVHTDLAS